MHAITIDSLLARLQIGNVDLVQEPASLCSLAAVVVPHSEERQRAELFLDAQNVVVDTAGRMFL